MLAGYSGTLVSSAFLAANPPCLAEGCARARVDLRAWQERVAVLGPATSLRAMLDVGAEPLVRALGFERVDDRHVAPDRASAILTAGMSPVALVVAPWGARLDLFARDAITVAAACGGAWALLFNGTHLRLLHAARVASRRFCEFDLEMAADDDRLCGALWGLCGAAALSTTDRTAPAAAFVASSEAHEAVTCRSLRAGVLEASEHVLRALAARRDTPVHVAYQQALTIVYRLLFLFFAEARALVPAWHPVYRQSYSVEQLRESALDHASVGLWSAVRAVSHLAHAGCRAGDLVVTAFNGRLFAPSYTPLVERRDLDDEAARRSLVALSTRPAADGEGREAVSYRDLGVEELGGVYETLLDYSPEVVAPEVIAPGAVPARAPRRRRDWRLRQRVALRPGSGVRKDTGSFYTPHPIATYLIRRTLGPLVRDATPEQILALTVVDPSMGSGALLVAACLYLADSYAAALVREGGCQPADIGPRECALIRRTIAERCLFGVDLNPMAVQLARLSLWLTTLAADRPLSFLDHHLVSGDSLIGAWIHSLRAAPGRRRAAPHTLPLFGADEIAEAMRLTVPVRHRLAEAPNDTAAQVRDKERALTELARGELRTWKQLADLWCAHWFADDLALTAGLYAAVGDDLRSGSGTLPRATVDRLLARAQAIAAEQRFFHWELEFPEVFFDRDGHRRANGGFDAVIGNPPWDMVRADAGPEGDRARARMRTGRFLRFTRDAGVYDAQSDGHANRYQLFLERALALTRPGGHVGLVLPGGLLSDSGSAALRQRLFARTDVSALVSFENRRRIFPIHRSVRFVLLSAAMGRPTHETSCDFGHTDPAILDTCVDDQGRPTGSSAVRLTPALLHRLSGNDLSIPDVRTPLDLTIAERAASLYSPLGSAAGWGVRFGRELNATEDARVFKAAGRGLPVLGGRHITPFRAHLSSAPASIGLRDARAALGDAFERRRLAYRDVASSTNRMTLIAAVLPAGCASTHTLYCLKSRHPLWAHYFLCGLFNSYVVNFLVRLRVTTHVTTRLTERLPIPREDQAGAAFRTIAALARHLERRDDPAAAARLQAVVARLYALSPDEFAHVLGSFPLVPVSDREQAHDAFTRQCRV